VAGSDEEAARVLPNPLVDEETHSRKALDAVTPVALAEKLGFGSNPRGRFVTVVRRRALELHPPRRLI
jgi:hypothetical protein